VQSRLCFSYFVPSSLRLIPVSLAIDPRHKCALFGALYTVSFHSIRRSRVTGGPDGDELWSLSRVTKAVDEYVFCHGFPRKWLQSHIESAKIMLGVQRLEIEQSGPFSSDFPHGSQVSTRNLTKIN
jgi:hypothetical protein